VIGMLGSLATVRNLLAISSTLGAVEACSRENKHTNAAIIAQRGNVAFMKVILAVVITDPVFQAIAVARCATALRFKLDNR
jgi:hypothetical protein